MDPTNELSYLRVGSKKQEILIAPGNYLVKLLIKIHCFAKRKMIFFLDEDFILIVIQNQMG
jgi:hypothetical protein